MVDVRRRAQEAGVDGVKMVDVRGRAQEAGVDGVKMVDVRGGHRRQVLMVSRWWM